MGRWLVLFAAAALAVGLVALAGRAPSAVSPACRPAREGPRPVVVVPVAEREREAVRARPSPGSVRELAADLPALLRGTAADPGGVVPPRPASGVLCRVVDRRGEPVMGEVVEVARALELWGPEGGRRHDAARGGATPCVLHFEAGVESGWLVLHPGLSRLALHPWFVDPLQPGARLRAVAGRTGVAVRAGNEVELVVAHGGTIRGSVLRAEGLAGGIDRVRVRATDYTGALDWRRFGDEQVLHAAIEEDGCFEVAGVDAGRRRVEFLLRRAAVHTVEDVEVHLESYATDLRLCNVDLNAVTREITLRVVDAADAPIAGAAGTVAQAGLLTFRGDGGHVRVLIPGEEDGAGPSELFVHGPGRVPVQVAGPFRDATVVLEPAVEVRVRTGRPFRYDIGTHGFRLRLRRVGAPDVAEVLWSVELPLLWDGVEPESIAAPGAGRYELEVLVLERSGSHLGRSPGDRFVGTGVFVDAAAPDVVVDVPEDLVRFAAALGDRLQR